VKANNNDNFFHPFVNTPTFDNDAFPQNARCEMPSTRVNVPDDNISRAPRPVERLALLVSIISLEKAVNLTEVKAALTVPNQMSAGNSEIATGWCT